MLTVIVPAHNEGSRIVPSVSKILKVCSVFSREMQVIIAEDGSTDSTVKEARSIKDKRVVLQHFPGRLGRGLALKRACKLVRGDKVIYMDADLATEITHTKEMFRLLDKNDIVIGSRYAKGSKAKRTRKRMFLGKAHMLVAQIIIPSLKVTDINCGFKGFRREVFEEMCKKVKSTDWNWDVEMLSRARKVGYSITEIPVEWKESDRTTVNMFRDTVSEFFGILRARFVS